MSTSLQVQRLPFASALEDNGDSPAVITAAGVLTYSELAGLVDDLGRRLGSGRRLVALTAGNDVDSLVAYLAALSYGHPLILLPADKPAALDSLVAAYDPDVVMRPGNGQILLDERRPGSRHSFHPDLALMLSTSGSTGSPKLVRLSYENLQANAESIATYLGITQDDRALTTLPMSYCYGLSVINSHLLRGASIVLTDLSVVDPCFWELFRSREASSFAAVPYTFDLLERVGFAAMDLPSLRYVTQAGGKLAPDLVRRYAELGSRRGWDLYVMYGQTEATARMAYLPPRLAGTAASAIGIPVPGGAFRIDPVPGLDDGELVYTGPNVMLGYAQSPEDLELGRTVSELRTGDLARRRTDGLYEVVGRRSRFVKIVGLRVDLGQVERILADLGIKAASAGTDQGLVVAVEGEHDEKMLTKVLAQDIGLPRAALDVHSVEELPRLASGKVDYPAVLALAQERAPDAVALSSGSAKAQGTSQGPDGSKPARDTVVQIFQDVLERTDITDNDTFVSLGGDSLSYVAASVRLEQALGKLPADWHITTVAALQLRAKPARQRTGRRLFARLETGIVLRTVSIVMIVSTHIGFLHWQGFAHVLLAVAGFNFARFQLAGEGWPRLKRQAASLARVVIPSMAFIGLAYLVTDKYSLANIVLLNAIIGPEEVTTAWHFWFIEVLVYMLAASAALLAVPWIGKAEKRFPFLFPLALFSAGLLTRYELVEPNIPHTTPALWLFALGWAAARARGVFQRCLVSALAVLTIPDFFDNPARELTVIAGILILLWLPSIPVPAGLRRITVLLASASLHIYLVHWLVYPPLASISPALAVVVSLAAGIAYWSLFGRVPTIISNVKNRIRSARQDHHAEVAGIHR